MSIYKVSDLCHGGDVFAGVYLSGSKIIQKAVNGFEISQERLIMGEGTDDSRGTNPNKWRSELSVLFNGGRVHQGAVETLWLHVQLHLKQMDKREQLEAQKPTGVRLRRREPGTRRRSRLLSGGPGGPRRATPTPRRSVSVPCAEPVPPKDT